MVDATAKKSDHPAFAAYAVDAVRKWKFEPGMQNGEPVPFTMIAPIVFSLVINYYETNLIHNLLLLLVLACTTSAQLATSPDILKRTFSETAFIEQFIGSYAALAQREPSPKPEEIKLLKELVELIPKIRLKPQNCLRLRLTAVVGHDPDGPGQSILSSRTPTRGSRCLPKCVTTPNSYEHIRT